MGTALLRTSSKITPIVGRTAPKFAITRDSDRNVTCANLVMTSVRRNFDYRFAISHSQFHSRLGQTAHDSVSRDILVHSLPVLN